MQGEVGTEVPGWMSDEGWPPGGSSSCEFELLVNASKTQMTQMTTD